MKRSKICESRVESPAFQAEEMWVRRCRRSLTCGYENAAFQVEDDRGEISSLVLKGLDIIFLMPVVRPEKDVIFITAGQRPAESAYNNSFFLKVRTFYH
jgi:hypothetical protein